MRHGFRQGELSRRARHHVLALTATKRIYSPLPLVEIALSVHPMFDTVDQLLIVTWVLLKYA